MPKKENFKHIETKVVHSGEPSPRILGSVSTPIFQSAMFESSGEGSYHEIRYIRLNNTPNHLVLHKKLASLEGAEDALVTGSGMAAITTTLLALLSIGDHVLVQDCLYGGTHDFVTKDLGQFGISYDFINANDPTSWELKLKPNTKAIYVETMTNPLLEVGDLKAVVEFARSHNLVSIIDNTFATSINFRPPEEGFDLSLHSATKYLNGHSDIVAGAVIGRADLVSKIKRRLDHLGGSLDPHACFLLERGIKTLAIRVNYQNESALKIAKYLAMHEGVKKVNYPGLETHLQHRRATELFEGYGGMLSFELDGGKDAAELFMKSVTIPIVAPSLGGVESLITTPATTSHSGMTPQDRQKIGITDGLIRFSVGVEATDDIIEDFEQAFETLGQRIPIKVA
ncbi:MAG: PLP-dependent aspartate aminotransferase family protein [archaeon]|nr:PLP-dependent aspartate aminotransferase family protein [archaeon]